jgi:cytochrome c553
MREKWARRIALLTSLLILVLAVIFSLIQNPTISTGVADESTEMPSVNIRGSAAPNPEHIEAGRQIYKQLACARCHSIAGKGNPRYPLDSVSVKHSADELRNWIIGADTLRGSLPAYILKLKKKYRDLSDHDFDMLVIYMQSLRQ